jgi:hypothetical protein
VARVLWLKLRIAEKTTKRGPEPEYLFPLTLNKLILYPNTIFTCIYGVEREVEMAMVERTGTGKKDGQG